MTGAAISSRTQGSSRNPPFQIIEASHASLLVTPRRLSDAADSEQVGPHRPAETVYRCYLPVLTGFTNCRRTGPVPQHHLRLAHLLRNAAQSDSAPL